jgi:hypothetical protein
MFTSSVARGIVLTGLLAPSIGLSAVVISSTGAPSAAAPAAAAPSSPPAMSSASQAAVDQRIQMLQSRLQITEAQMPLWSAFAQAMRDNAAATDTLFTERAGAVATMSATDNMHSYAQIARAYADNTERLAAAFEAIYASLSDTQKQAADTLFRQQATAAARPRGGR